ncbi:hypothetical protein M514_28260 [Trichuris suis]|uniref:Uncharacterized protein n=1 Tax=Trichuris suis TaxID=68888 RepID=A0A085MQR6_9BILA|nr:hypothetical protein M514_28260 [Trichuris suis]
MVKVHLSPPKLNESCRKCNVLSEDGQFEPKVEERQKSWTKSTETRRIMQKTKNRGRNWTDHSGNTEFRA